MSAPVTCDLCGDGFDTVSAFMDHLRVMHPDRYEDVATWPDGAPVVEDTTLEPHDFGGAA